MFTKGQQVTFLCNWDSKGTVAIVDLIVHSCGKKQMILVDDQGIKYQGRLFFPTEDQLNFSRVVSRLSPEAAEALALEIGAQVATHEAAEKLRKIAHYGYGEEHAYTRSMRKSIADIHEPRTLRR